MTYRCATRQSFPMREGLCEEEIKVYHVGPFFSEENLMFGDG